MSYLKITIFDGAIPLLDEISKVSYGLGLDALDQAGAKIRNEQRKALINSGSHGWGMKVSKNSKRYITYTDKKNRRYGTRTFHTNGKPGKPSNMLSMINSFLMEKNMTMVVNGMHPAFTAKTRRDGKVVGYQKRVKGVTRSTYEILKKLDSGKIDEDYEKHVRSKSMEVFENAKYKKTNYAQRGYQVALPQVKQLMGSKFEKILGRTINNLKVKEVKVS